MYKNNYINTYFNLGFLFQCLLYVVGVVVIVKIGFGRLLCVILKR